MREVFDLAIAFDTKPPSLVQLVFEPPLDFELEAVDFGLVSELPNEAFIVAESEP